MIIITPTETKTLKYP